MTTPNCTALKGTGPCTMSQTGLPMNPITVSIPINRTICESILSIALEGGINYWATVTAAYYTDDPEARLPKILEKPPAEGCVLYWAAKIVEEDEDDAKLHNLDYSVIRTGLERMLTLDHRTGQYPLGSVEAREYFWQDFGEWIMNGGPRDRTTIFGGQMDVGACDVVVQLGLFGEVVYG